MGGQEKKKSNRRAGNDAELVRLVNLLKPGGMDLNLMQNCDLPPPSKVFVGGSDKTVMLSMNRVCKNSKNEFEEFVNGGNEGNIDNDKVELLKTLRSSQTRAREAEKKAAILRKEKEWLSNAVLADGMELFAYRQQLRLLQLQVSNLQSLCPLQQQQSKGGVGSLEEEDGDDAKTAGVDWIFTLALSWGIGVCTALACRYLL
ncbi:hypothetical protein L6164_025182 [Bauhinia variegata]|uniref:Uncharacterized protein n=1 Tax=Bauhinia variegata TaxID=167791 RepID=A0ACB9LZT1_BAUVA|nr:hypothetical protein L6164_025182 [Bauhinia variegata]